MAAGRLGDPPQGHADCVAALEQVLDVSRRPSEAALPVVCRGETPRQLIRETHAPVPAAPGRPAHADSACHRCGSGNAFLATEPWAGRRRTKVTARKTQTDGARGLRASAERHPGARRITLGRDNLHAPRPGILAEALAPAAAQALRDRCEFVPTPQHSSWLNVAEVELSVLIQQGLHRRSASLEVRRAEIAAWQAARGRLRSQVNWQFTTDDARARLKRIYLTLYE